MCVIAWAWRVHPRWPLAVLANRDERHARATAPLEWWPDAPEILAGRDLEAGGTWLGITRSGRFAALTNRAGAKPPDAPSRGGLAVDLLAGRSRAGEAAEAIAASAGHYAGFNLLIADGEQLALVSNREPSRVLETGVHGMANDALDEAVPKVERLKAVLSAWCEEAREPDVDAWLDVLADSRPLRGDGPASAIFVRNADYGTRSSSIVLCGPDGGLRFVERRFDADGRPMSTANFAFASRR
ncbi:MAG: NRDE family protein [Gammaproteobacteria bacterium]